MIGIKTQCVTVVLMDSGASTLSLMGFHFHSERLSYAQHLVVKFGIPVWSISQFQTGLKYFTQAQPLSTWCNWFPTQQRGTVQKWRHQWRCAAWKLIIKQLTVAVPCTIILLQKFRMIANVFFLFKNHNL